jgi:hypothetical protein
MQPQQGNEGPATSSLIAVDSDELAERLLEPATMQAIYEDTEAIIAGNRTPEGLFALVANALDTMEAVWSDLKADTVDYACKKGCSWCCHQSVMATAAEVLYAAKFLHDNLSPSEVLRLRDKVAARARQTEGLDNDQRMDRRIACAFLNENICTIYPVRPLQCRGGYSEDADYCRNLLEHREETQTAVANGTIDGKYLLVPKMLYDSAQVGMAGALQKDGLNSDPLDLATAMAIALGDRDIADKWLRGLPVFERARLHRQDGPKAERYATRPAQ